MKQHGNTLYVTTQQAYLAKSGTNVVVRVEKKAVFRAPIHTIDSIVCFGNVTCSPFLMGLCGSEGVSLVFLSERGRFLARVQGKQSGNVLLRRAQHRVTTDPEGRSGMAWQTIIAKVANARAVLQRGLRDHEEKIEPGPVRFAVNRLQGLIGELKAPLPVEQVRGVEGDSARYYFGAFDQLIVAQKEAFFLHKRTRRPPMDNMNAILSFLDSHKFTSRHLSVDFCTFLT